MVTSITWGYPKKGASEISLFQGLKGQWNICICPGQVMSRYTYMNISHCCLWRVMEQTGRTCFVCSSYPYSRIRFHLKLFVVFGLDCFNFFQLRIEDSVFLSPRTDRPFSVTCIYWFQGPLVVILIFALGNLMWDSRNWFWHLECPFSSSIWWKALFWRDGWTACHACTCPSQRVPACKVDWSLCRAPRTKIGSNLQMLRLGWFASEDYCIKCLFLFFWAAKPFHWYLFDAFSVQDI